MNVDENNFLLKALLFMLDLNTCSISIYFVNISLLLSLCPSYDLLNLNKFLRRKIEIKEIYLKMIWTNWYEGWNLWFLFLIKLHFNYILIHLILHQKKYINFIALCVEILEIFSMVVHILVLYRPGLFRKILNSASGSAG